MTVLEAWRDGRINLDMPATLSWLHEHPSVLMPAPALRIQLWLVENA